MSSPTQPHSTKSKKSSTTPQTKNSDSGTQLPRNHSNLSVRSDSHGPSRIRPIATQDAIGGDIPPYGFVLRSSLCLSIAHLSLIDMSCQMVNSVQGTSLLRLILI